MIETGGKFVDFGAIKRVLKCFDHKCLLNKEDPLAKLLGGKRGIIAIDGDPTAENLAQFFRETIESKFGVKVVMLAVWETDSNCALIEQPHSNE